jgi:trehalose/maltose hydrolase-like predicted phosphorylase
MLAERAEDREEASHFATVADLLVDGFDAKSGIYEQFEGFRNLEPLLISEHAKTPVAADLLLGRDRVRGAQVLKQADVLMLHHMVPLELSENSLRPNLDYYLPRTAHGSSLSPAVHAALLARAGDTEKALEWLRLASRIDLDDLTNATASGLHLATMGGVWQAMVYGFLGARATPDGALELSPNLPAQWEGVRVRLVLRSVAVSVVAFRDAVEVLPKRAMAVHLYGVQTIVPATGARFRKTEQGWKCETV